MSTEEIREQADQAQDKATDTVVAEGVGDEPALAQFLLRGIQIENSRCDKHYQFI